MTSSFAQCRHPTVKPAIFEEFFGLGKEEIASPFLTPDSRKWGVNLTLKASGLAALFLICAFILSFFSSQLALSHFFLLLVYFLAGIPSLISSIEDLSNFDVNIDMLMTLAAFSSVFIGSGMEGGLLLVLFALSGAIEDSVRMKAKGSLNSLHKLSPSIAFVIDDKGRILERSVKDIPLGTRILIKAGEIVPLDGFVIEGISSVNLVHLTGENVPIIKKIGDEVPAGARNMEGTLTLEVNHTSVDSTLARIIQLVTQAQEARPRLQRWFDSLSRSYALTIISLSAFFALTFPLIFQMPFLGVEGSLYRALAFLIAASPCALILAIPIAYLSAVSACARNGILVKGGITLDALAQCKIIAFDKTGTLTTGDLTCTEIEKIGSPLENKEKEKVLAAAYSLEKNAVHPIAKAVCTFATEKDIPFLAVENFQLIPGYGVEGQILTDKMASKAFMGHPQYILEKISPTQRDLLQKRIEFHQQQGTSLAILLIDSSLYLFAFQDTVRPHIKKTLQTLQTKGRERLLMLTGDHASNARAIAEQLGIKEYYANLRPENKLDFVTRLSEQGLAMVGDGINDAPALARATVGISLGKVGSGTALEVADAIFLHDNLEHLDWLMEKSKDTQAIVRENLILAAGAILIAAVPALAGFVPLWLAVVMHEGGTVLVGLNALRLLR